MRLSNSRFTRAAVAPVALSLSLSGAALALSATSAHATDDSVSNSSQVSAEAQKVPANLKQVTGAKLGKNFTVTAVVAAKRPVPVPKGCKKGYASGTAVVKIGKKTYKGTFALNRKKGALTPKKGAVVIGGLKAAQIKGKKLKLLRAQVQFVSGTKISAKRTVVFNTKPTKITIKKVR